MDAPKKNRLYAIFPLTAAALALSIAACGNKTTSADAANTDDATQTDEVVFKADSIGWTDTIKTTKTSATCQISVDYPVEGNSGLVGSVRKWIGNRLATDYSVSPDSKAPYTPDQSLLDNGSALIANIGKRVLDQALPELRSLDSLRIDPGMSFEYYWNIRNAYDTDKYVTYTVSNYTYLGGAHGSSSFNGQVFRASDGKMFGWDNIFQADSLPALKKLVKEGIRTQYFKDLTAEDFRNGLLVNPDTLPLPASQPYFNEKGVNFIYQQYEIAIYAAGMPECVLPFSEVKAMMTPEAAALVD